MFFGEEKTNINPYFYTINYKDISWGKAFFASLNMRYPIGNRNRNFLISELGWNVIASKLKPSNFPFLDEPIISRIHYFELNLENGVKLNDKFIFTSGLGFGMAMMQTTINREQNEKTKQNVFKDGVGVGNLSLNFGLLYLVQDRFEILLKLQQGITPVDRIDEKYINNPLLTNVKIGFGIVL